MKILLIVFAIALMFFLIDKAGLWLERKGYLYYRVNKPKKGIFGSALLELNAHLSPSNKYVIEIKQDEIRFKKTISMNQQLD